MCPLFVVVVCVQDKVTVPDRDYSTQRVILGTHTSENEQNHLIIAGANALDAPHSSSRRRAAVAGQGCHPAGSSSSRGHWQGGRHLQRAQGGATGMLAVPSSIRPPPPPRPPHTDIPTHPLCHA